MMCFLLNSVDMIAGEYLRMNDNFLIIQQYTVLTIERANSNYDSITQKMNAHEG